MHRTVFLIITFQSEVLFMKKSESPNILLAKLSEVLYGNHAAAGKKLQKAKPTKTECVA